MRERIPVAELCEVAEDYYSDELPYHNWAHVLDVMRHADEIADLAEQAGVRVNPDTLQVAAAWHDADYHEPLAHFTSKEWRSAILARDAMRRYGIDDDTTADVSCAIIDTTVDKRPKFNELGIALHYADIGYLADPDYNRFFERLDLLRQEYGAPHWQTMIDRTRRFGAQVIVEAGEELPQVIGVENTGLWIARLRHNLDKLPGQEALF